MSDTIISKPNNNIPKRIIVMVIGNIIMGLGIAIFKFSLMGNDPCNASYMALADFFGIPYAFMSWIVNGSLFVVEIILGRKYIGVGTFVNWFLVGVVATFFHNIITVAFIRPESFIGRLPILIIGVLVLGLSCSLYQKANIGVSPYDSIPIIISEKTPIPFFICRITQDGLFAFIAWRAGGIIGLGTLVCALGLGPFITMFDKLVSERILSD